MSANFTPNQNEYKNLTPFKSWLLLQINTWGQVNFPFVESDFDELTNYGMLQKLMGAVNDVIANENLVEQDMTNLFNAFTELQSYVNNYFDNLDVQDEINNKLDDLVADGTLTTLIGNYVQPLIDAQNSIIESIRNEVQSVASGSPLVATSTSEMTDTTRVYVNTSDGKWYYYDGDSWEIGGIYQATQLPNDSVTPEKTIFMEKIGLIPDDEWVSGKILNYTTGNEQSFPGASYSKEYVEIPANKTKIVYESHGDNGLHIYYYDSSKTFIESQQINNGTFSTIVEDAKYLRVGFSTSTTKPDDVLVYYEDFISGMDIYDKGYLKNEYNSLNSRKIEYNAKKLNILPYVYNKSVINPTIDGNDVVYNFVDSTNNVRYVGFAINWDVKVNDTIKVEFIGDHPQPPTMSLYPTQSNSLAIKTGDGTIAGFNIVNNKGSITLTSEHLTKISNNSVYLTYRIPATETSVTYNYRIRVQINDDPYYFVDLLEEYANQIQPTYKAMFLGDSITALAGTRGWWTYFNEKLNITDYVNVAVSGAHLTDYNDSVYDGNPVYNGPDENHNNVLGNQVQKIINHQNEYVIPDIIMIAIGTNDGIVANDQQIYNTYCDANRDVVPLTDVDRKTSAGAFRYCTEKLRELYPNAVIFWCSPIQASYKTRRLDYIIQWGDALERLTKFGSVQFIDTEKCGITGYTEEPQVNGLYLIDGLHPNVNGAKYMGYYNATKVKEYLDFIDTIQ